MNDKRYEDMTPDEVRESMSDEKLELALRGQEKEAEKILEDEESADSFLNKLRKKVENIPALGKYLADIFLLGEMVGDYAHKRYTKIPQKSIIAITAALAYIVSPIDIVPDVLPVIGYLDDIALLVFVLNSLHKDIQNYKAWKGELQRWYDKVEVVPEQQYILSRVELDDDIGSLVKFPIKLINRLEQPIIFVRYIAKVTHKGKTIGKAATVCEETNVSPEEKRKMVYCLNSAKAVSLLGKGEILHLECQIDCIHLENGTVYQR